MKSIHHKIIRVANGVHKLNRISNVFLHLFPMYIPPKDWSSRHDSAVRTYCKAYRARLYTLVFGLLFVSVCSGQSVSLKKALIKSGILYVSGMIQGAHEANLHHYERFDRVHSIANDG